MTTTTATQPGLYGTPGEPKHYLNETRGLWSWMSTLDHKRIGLMYLVGVLGSFFLGGMFAILLRTEHLTPHGTILHDVLTAGGTLFKAGDQYNQLFTLHGAIMVFLFIIPSIPAALGNFFLPIMLGTMDVAFPRLNLFSFYLWCGGAVCFICALVFGGLDAGWTFYAPYSTSHSPYHWGILMALTGVFILGFSSILTGLNFIATVHLMRAPGMGWFQLPLFIWALYSTALLQILATPVLAITLLLLILERTIGIGIFDPQYGGDPVLMQHFFWFYSHPAVYIMILPAMGVVSELVATYSHKHIFGYRFIAFSSLAIALLSFFVWGHHMFVSGQSTLVGATFSLITMAVAIPSAIKVFNWLATMYKGSIELTAAMLYAMAFIWVFSLGGLTGLPLATMATDVPLHDTYFVVAHFHYVAVGGTVFAFLGGLLHWWPKMFGRLFSERWAVIGFVFIFVGFNLTFFPQFFLGTQGMPRRYFDYPPEYQFLHVLSTSGAYTQLVGFIITAFVLIRSLVAGRRSPDNPWGGTTLEWQTVSPPPLYNFHSQPTAGDPYTFYAIEYDDQTGGYRRRPGAVPPAEH
jgi:cytochrome c oxidase subunit I